MAVAEATVSPFPRGAHTKDVTHAINTIREIAETRLPIFGICLGHQLLSLAFGAKTKKMKFGHHGANHPVQDLSTNKVYVTSQNHGFTVDEDSLPNSLDLDSSLVS